MSKRINGGTEEQEQQRQEQLKQFFENRSVLMTFMGSQCEEVIELFDTGMGTRSIYWTTSEVFYGVWRATAADLEAEAAAIPQRPKHKTWTPVFFENPERIVPHVHEAVSSIRLTRSSNERLAFDGAILADPVAGPIAIKDADYHDRYHVHVPDLLAALNMNQAQLRRKSGSEYRVRLLRDGTETRMGFTALCVLSAERPEIVQGGRHAIKRKDAKNDPKWHFGSLDLFAA
ncbi:hypothetical protein MASR1M60_07700 [Rhodocyclaceae bacterium]